MTKIQRYAFLFAIAFLAIPLAAQKYREETVDRLGIGFAVVDRLDAVPNKFKAETPQLVVQYQSTKDSDHIQSKIGAQRWALTVMQFDPVSNLKPITGEAEEDDGEQSPDEQISAAMRAIMEKWTAHSFEEYVREKDFSDNDTRKFIVSGKKIKGSQKRPPHVWWEYTNVHKTWNGFWVVYKYAAVYRVDGKEVALICTIPVGVTKAENKVKPDKKYQKMAKKMLSSVVFVERDDDDVTDKVRDKYADTKERKAELAKLKDNIKDFDNWDYFTTPEYMICFSWDRRDSKDRTPAYQFAIMVGDKLSDIHEKYESHFPPHEGMEHNYSVVRICSDYKEYTQYGGPQGSGGVFNPRTKELCVFRDFTQLRNWGLVWDEDTTVGVVFHEAWHQYADRYWPDVTLHRWFDEGLAEVFGSWRKKGNAWRTNYHVNRHEAMESLIRMDSLINADKIIGWPRSKFYGGGATDYYAQAWVMVDFLMRGEEKLGSQNWDPSWSKILENYGEACLKLKGNEPEKAAKAAIEGIDIEKFEAAWRNWYNTGMVKKG